MTSPHPSLHWRRWPGDGAPVVALHGFGGSGLDFHGLWEATGLAVSAPDLLGHGQSPGPGAAADHALEAQVATVLPALGANPVLLGYSMGARLALHVALRSASSLRGLVLIGGSPGLVPGAEKEARERWDGEMADDLRREGTATFMERWARLPVLQGRRRRMPREALEAMDLRRASGDPLALAACLEGFGRGSMPDAWDDLEALSLPTLLLVGEEDAPHRKIAQAMHNRLPRSAVEVIEGTGHAPHMERPGDLAMPLLGWLRAL